MTTPMFFYPFFSYPCWLASERSSLVNTVGTTIGSPFSKNGEGADLAESIPLMMKGITVSMALKLNFFGVPGGGMPFACWPMTPHFNGPNSLSSLLAPFTVYMRR